MARCDGPILEVRSPAEIHRVHFGSLLQWHPAAFDGQFYGSLLQLAELLRKEFPAAAWELYWALLQDILDQKRSKAYHHAADYLAIAGELAERANLTTRHHELVAILRNDHKRKNAFWGRVGS